MSGAWFRVKPSRREMVNFCRISASRRPSLKSWRRRAGSGVKARFWWGCAGRPAAVVGVKDPVKAVEKAVGYFRSRGLKVVMLTGDARATAEAIARETGIENFEAGFLAADERIIKKLKAEGRVVAMAGDGINDAPALALADVGIAMGSGTDIAMQSAGVTLVKGDLLGVVRAHR